MVPKRNSGKNAPVIYSCITGGYDRLGHILASYRQPGLRHVIFVDSISRSEVREGWELRPLRPVIDQDPVRVARWYKVHCTSLFPHAPASVWIDGAEKIKPKADVLRLIEEALKSHDLASFRHPLRKCVFEELQACIKRRKDDPDVMRTQIARYAKEGYPANNGMVETACVVRRHNARIDEFNGHWWGEISKGSRRDQLSFNYVCWKMKLPYRTFPGCRDDSPWFTFRHHPGPINA